MTVTVPSRVDGDRLSVHPLVDLGGLPADVGTTRHGVLFRAPSVSDLPEPARARLRRLPLARRVDLRATFELRDAPAPDFGERVVGAVHVPLLDTDCPQAYRDRIGAVLQEGGLPALYRLMAREGGGAVARALRAVVANAERGLASVLHCTSGRDRSGVVTALLLAGIGVRPEAIDAHQAQFCADGLIDLTKEPVPASPVEELLAAIEAEWGGAGAYLRAHGVDAATLGRLRSALLTA